MIGHSYGFYSVATDNVGHSQPAPTTAQATTRLVAPLPPPPPPPPLVTVSSVHVATIKAGKGKKAKSTTGLLIQFSGELNSARAQSLAAYKLVTAGKDKKFGTKDDKSVKLSSAQYNAAARTVTLIPKSSLNKTQLMEIVLSGGQLTDTLGREIDGNHDGQPGGNSTATIKGKTVSIATAKALARLSASAVDHVLGAIRISQKGMS